MVAWSTCPEPHTLHVAVADDCMGKCAKLLQETPWWSLMSIQHTHGEVNDSRHRQGQ